MAVKLEREVSEAPSEMPARIRAKGAGNAGTVWRRRRRKSGATQRVEVKSAAATLRKKPWRRKEWTERKRHVAQNNTMFDRRPRGRDVQGISVCACVCASGVLIYKTVSDRLVTRELGKNSFIFRFFRAKNYFL